MTAPISISTPAVPQRPEAPRPMFSTLAISSSGLTAQRIRMDVIAQNLANAETTRTTEGGPYQRRTVNLEAIKPQDASTIGAPSASLPGDPTFGGTSDATGGVRVASIGEDKTPGAMVYDPGHPDADKNGYVHMPNVNTTDEMIDLMNARRLYEANA